LLEHGAHLTDGSSKNIAAFFIGIPYDVVAGKTGKISRHWLEVIAQNIGLEITVIGALGPSHTIDFERVGENAKKCGVIFLADIAQVPGLSIVGLHSTPTSKRIVSRLRSRKD
jgi:glycine hydroxymethyltransferase